VGWLMKIRLLVAAAAVSVAGICWATPAHADQDGYLKRMTDEGIDMSQADMLKSGYRVCNSLYQGYPEQQVASTLMMIQHQTDPAEIQLLVSTAHSQLCPDARG
jgi:hypothetical protein